MKSFKRLRKRERGKQFKIELKKKKEIAKEAGDKYLCAVICKHLAEHIEMVINAFVRLVDL